MALLELLPDGNDSVQWSPSAIGQPNYTMVDEGSGAAIDETDNVNEITDGQSDRYTWTYNPALDDATINYVRINFRAKNTNDSGNENIKGLYRESSTNYYTSTITLTDDWATYTETWTTNPATSNAWTDDEIENGIWGMEAAIGRGRFNRTWVATAWLTISYTPASIGYGNDVIGIDSGDISKIKGIATADISKVNGV